MGESLRIRWVQLLALPLEWENQFLAALESFDAHSHFVEFSPGDANIYVIAYPASAHAGLKVGKRIAERLATLPDAKEARLVLVACDRSKPKVNTQQVSQLLDEQITSDDGPRHGYWLASAGHLEPVLHSILEVSLRAAGTWPDYINSESASMADSSYQEKDWKLFQ